MSVYVCIFTCVPLCILEVEQILSSPVYVCVTVCVGVSVCPYKVTHERVDRCRPNFVDMGKG